MEKKILIVDDKPENLKALEKLLQGYDVIIIKASSGNQALSLTLEHDFALALIDVQMPDMDGYEVVKLIRNVDKTRFLPVVFLSAIYSENHYLIQGIEAGAVDFITKPIQPRILLGKVKVFLDLFEQKKMLELEIEEHKKTVVSLRKTEAELIIAKQKAEEADKLKTAFLANMSHEIRTPLNAIVGFSQLLLTTTVPEEKRGQFLDIITSSSDTLTAIIGDILDIAKIEAGQLKIAIAPVDIFDTMDEIYITFHEELKRRNKAFIELELVVPTKKFNYTIESDSIRLKQVLTNLLTNALKFTNAGKISFGFTMAADDNLEFFVADTGIGIPDDKMDIIFDRFQQVSNEKASYSTGTGLGLSIVKKLVEILGGKIWVKSTIDCGSQFYFTIPHKISNKFLQRNESNKMAVSSLSVDWEGYSILVAEDEDLNSRLIKELISTTKASAVFTKNGRDALDAIASGEHFDLVLMDIKMPIMSGIEAFHEIRKINTTIPIIAQTAYAMASDIENFLKLGFNGYLTKPLRQPQFYSTIGSFLS